jgi:hypothetical protein
MGASPGQIARLKYPGSSKVVGTLPRLLMTVAAPLACPMAYR